MNTIVSMSVFALMLMGATSAAQEGGMRIVMQPGDKRQIVLEEKQSVTFEFNLPTPGSCSLTLSTESAEVITLGMGIMNALIKNGQPMILRVTRKAGNPVPTEKFVNVTGRKTAAIDVELSPMAAEEPTTRDFWVAAESLPVRGAPTTSTDVETAGSLSAGTKVTATQVCDPWVHIEQPKQGWVFGPALVTSEADFNKRKASAAVMRKVTLHQFWHKEGNENVSHLLSWISGEFPIQIRGGAIVAPEAELGHGAFIEHFQPDLQGAPLLGKPTKMRTGDILVLKTDGWHKLGRWEAPFGGLPEVDVDDIKTWKSEQGIVLAEPLPEASEGGAALSTKMLPEYEAELIGKREVRITNPNDFAVLAGVRSGKSGANLTVPANGQRSTYVPDGRYEIYFVYSNKPDALFQGDSFTLEGNGVEIKIVKVVGGNYGIRQVK